jgi:ribose 5-phosphate isomerase A
VDDKQLVGIEAAKYVKNGMVVGLGTGSTATHFIRELARRIKDEKLSLKCIPSSFACAILARENGMPLISVDQVAQVDLYVDGADEVAPDKGLIKGRGAAMVGEKLLCEACDQFIVIVDGGKLVKSLGEKFPVPVEIMPGALLIAQRAIISMGGAPALRQSGGKDGPVVTDNGNLILDVIFPKGSDWQKLDQALDSLPGVVEHGLFLRYANKSQVLIGIDGAVQTIN